MVGRSFNETLEKYPKFNVWGNVKKLFENNLVSSEPRSELRGQRLLVNNLENNILIGNLETTITDHKEKNKKTFNFKLSPKYAYILKGLPFTYLGIANNHILDYKYQGMKDTMKNLDKLGISYTGEMKSGKCSYVSFVRSNIKIAVFSATDHYEEWKDDVCFVDLGESGNLIKIMRKLSKEHDIVIFSIHHGSNYVSEIPKETIELFHSLIDNGATIIHGHSSHHVLPVEKYKNGYILYGMGDFIDDYHQDEKWRNDLSYIAEFEITRNNDSLKKSESAKSREKGGISRPVGVLNITLRIHPTKITIEQVDNIFLPRVDLIDKNDDDYDKVVKYITTKKLL